MLNNNGSRQKHAENVLIYKPTLKSVFDNVNNSTIAEVLNKKLTIQFKNKKLSK